MTIVTGKMSFPISVTSTGPVVTRTESLKALLDPTLTPGQFRKATATAALSNIGRVAGTPPSHSTWAIDDAQATFDDEAGRGQFVVGRGWEQGRCGLRRHEERDERSEEA